jgi:TM2 domain-containing membrane protein YozV/RNA polymerase subunit RPABC4/transcription elongation factor Spt4
VVNTCTSCGAIISTGSTTCASCGAPQRRQVSGGGGGFCGSCGTALISKNAPCPSCGHVKTTFNPQQANSGFCGSCGAALIGKSTTCMKCGYTKTKYNPMTPPQGALYKNEGTGLILSIVLGLFCLNGIGQIYAGKVGRGIGIMIGSWVLIVVGILTFGIGLIAYLAIFIWQIFDTKKLCREFNEYVSQNGRPPW